MADISTEWDSFAATVRHYQYNLLTPAQEADGLTATIVVASWDVWEHGAACPDGYTFGDGSTVEATSGQPRTSNDFTEMHKDDGAKRRDLYGEQAQENVWHKEIREDIDKAPDADTYDQRKVYINPRWDLKEQLDEIKKGKVTKRIKKARRGVPPKWISRTKRGK